MNILLAAILTVNIALVVIICLFLIRVRGVYREIVGYISAPGEGQPSPLARTVEAAADILSRSLVAQAKATFLGKQSGAVRAEKALAGDIAEDMLAAKIPLASAILGSFPTLKKTLRRNPALLDQALALLARQTGGGSGGSPAPGSNGKTEIAQFTMDI